MNVELLSYQKDALYILLQTKNTRLKFDTDVSVWPEEQRQEHLSYMRDTIKSSWEFSSYIFKITGVSRAFTHQLVRTRAGSYAQESQRTVDARDNGFILPEDNQDVNSYNIFNAAVEASFGAYKNLVDRGMPVQDARGVLPTATATSIIAQYSLRTLSDMAKVRLCVRTQGEFQSVFRRMRELVLEVHPWAREFIQVQCVADGTCAFPRYGKTQCPVYDPRMDQTQVKADTAKKFWATKRHVAIPVAKDGKTM